MVALSQARWPGMSSDAREAIAVSLHAIDRYRQRVAARASVSEARAAISSILKAWSWAG